MINQTKYNITLPMTTEMTLVKFQNITHFYVYNTFFFYKIARPTIYNELQIDSSSNSIMLKYLHPNNSQHKIEQIFKLFFSSWYTYFFNKIKFTGKGYRITFRRKKRMIKFFFGRSHPTIVLFRSIKIKKPHKYKFVILNNSLNRLSKITLSIKSIKPINLYTKRGLRTSRQIIFKRKSNKKTF